MSVTVLSVQANAMDTTVVQVEACFMRGFVGLQLVGHVSEVCRSGLERVKASLEVCSLALPAKKIALSLAPADRKMEGSQFDLAFAVVLAWLISRKKPVQDPSRWIFVAELGLSGRLQATKNIISFAMMAIEKGFLGIILARENLAEIEALRQVSKSHAPGFKALVFSNLEEVLSWFFEGEEPDFSNLKSSRTSGQVLSERKENFDDMLLSPELEELALTVAVGAHSLLLAGSPGTGKSMFLSRIISILPMMESKTHLQALRIHSSSAQRISPELLAGVPPFRSPHHQGSVAAILGVPEQAGELSLAHGGVLFLDELAEYRRDLLEGLREPLETRQVRVVRARAKAVWQAEAILLAATNLCPCGWYGSQKKACRCRIQQILNYRRKLSGPILDRIDLHVNLFEAKSEKSFFLPSEKNSFSSQSKRMFEKVLQIKKKSKKRNSRWNVINNSSLPPFSLLEACGLEQKQLTLLLKSFPAETMSKRALVRSLRVARTLADLDSSEQVSQRHLLRAFSWQQEAAAKKRGDEALGLI